MEPPIIDFIAFAGLFVAHSINGNSHQQANLPAVEAGLTNAAYTHDAVDGNDVIMMMDTNKSNGSAALGETHVNGRNGGAVSSSFKVGRSRLSPTDSNLLF